MAVTQYRISSYSSIANYKKFDIFLDTALPRYYYATQNNSGQPITSFFSYTITSELRNDDIITLFYTKTGSGPDLTQGSLIIATEQSEPSAHYTGMILDATPSYIRYTNPGPDYYSSSSAGRIDTILNPCWTTGFFFVPSYNTSFEKKNKVISAQFGDGYSQRQRDGLNSSQNIYNATFENRSNRETKAILNFIEDKAGVETFKILMPVNILSNDPDIKYTAVDPKVSTQSFDSNTINLTLTQVFDV